MLIYVGERTAVGSELAKLRHKHGEISQRDLSLAARYDIAYVGKIENGTVQQPSRQRIERLAAAMGASRDELERLLRLSGHLRAGERLVEPGRPSMEVYLRGDPDLTNAQREVLLSTYQLFVQRNRGGG